MIFTSSIHSVITKCGCSHSMIIAFTLLCSVLWGSLCLASSYQEEEQLDRDAGILDRPWQINLIRMASRDYLRAQTRIKTGLPNYDQLVEGTRFAPTITYDKLTTNPSGYNDTPLGAQLTPNGVSVNNPAISAPPTSTPSSQTPTSPSTSSPPAPPTNITIQSSPTLPFNPNLTPTLPTLPSTTPPPQLPPSTTPGPSVIP